MYNMQILKRELRTQDVRRFERIWLLRRRFAENPKSEIRNSKFEIAAEFPAMMLVPAAGVAEWQTLGT
jgi:hypothetical protein